MDFSRNVISTPTQSTPIITSSNARCHNPRDADDHAVCSEGNPKEVLISTLGRPRESKRGIGERAIRARASRKEASSTVKAIVAQIVYLARGVFGFWIQNLRSVKEVESNFLSAENQPTFLEIPRSFRVEFARPG
eukprot:COSAG02_NODE_999_length_15328_cov_8.086360_13_plen_135_part_00